MGTIYRIYEWMMTKVFKLVTIFVGEERMHAFYRRVIDWSNERVANFTPEERKKWNKNSAKVARWREG